jgi:hypothetical protein
VWRDVPASRCAARGLRREAEIEGRTPCPAVGVPRRLARRRRDAEDVGRAAAGALVGEVRALLAEPFARFRGRTPSPAVRRILIASVSESMRRQRAAPARRRAIISAE